MVKASAPPREEDIEELRLAQVENQRNWQRRAPKAYQEIARKEPAEQPRKRGIFAGKAQAEDADAIRFAQAQSKEETKKEAAKTAQPKDAPAPTLPLPPPSQRTPPATAEPPVAPPIVPPDVPPDVPPVPPTMPPDVPPDVPPDTTAPAPDVAPAPVSTFSLAQMMAAQVRTAGAGAPGAQLTGGAGTDASSTGELVERAPSVSVRRTSAINLDPRIRGYHSSQLAATANGMALRKTRIDIDSLFSSVDPGLVSALSVVDGPYTSLYGPGFAFLVAELFEIPRYEDGPEAHITATFSQGLNGRSLYHRETFRAGGLEWGAVASHGLRVGNDFHPGGNAVDLRVPASYNQWDAFAAASLDLTKISRVEFNYIRTEKNNIELPGVVYDINQSKDELFNVRYIVQDDKEGPQNVVVQYWWTRTPYNGDATRPSKQQTFYQSFITDDYSGFGPPFEEFNLINTIGVGHLQSTGARALVTWGEKDTTQFTLGVDWTRYELQYQETHQDSTAFADTVIFGADIFGIPSSAQENMGLFTNLFIPIVEDKVSATFGGRVDLNRSWVELDPVSFGGTFTGDKDPEEVLGMGYGTLKTKVSEHWSANIGTGYAMRPPGLAEYYSDGPFVPIVRLGNSVITGDSGLRPERTLQYDAGLTGQYERITGGVRAFHASVENYILYVFNGPVGRFNGPFTSRDYTYTNLERATMYGGDAFTEIAINDWCSTTATLAYVKGTNHSPQDGKGAEGLPGIYPFNSSVGIRFHDPKPTREARRAKEQAEQAEMEREMKRQEAREKGATKPPASGSDPIKKTADQTNEPTKDAAKEAPKPDAAEPRQPRQKKQEPIREMWSIEIGARMVNGQHFVADSLLEAQTAGFTTVDIRAHVYLNDNIRVTTALDNLLDRAYTEHGSLAVVDRFGNFSFVKEPGITWRAGVEIQY